MKGREGFFSLHLTRHPAVSAAGSDGGLACMAWRLGGSGKAHHLVFVDRAFEIPSAESTPVAQPPDRPPRPAFKLWLGPAEGKLSKFASRALPLGSSHGRLGSSGKGTAVLPRLLPLHRLTLETLPEVFAAQCDLVPQLGRELAGLLKLNVFPTPSSVNLADDGESQQHGTEKRDLSSAPYTSHTHCRYFRSRVK
jgi:hypothetical protein